MTPKQQLKQIAEMASNKPWWSITNVETASSSKWRCSIIHDGDYYTSDEQESENLAISICLHHYMRGANQNHHKTGKA